MINLISTWSSWYFPGFPQLLDMISLAFWWSIAIALGLIPLALAALIFVAIMDS